MAARLLAEQRRALVLPGTPDEIAHRAEGVKVTVSAMLASLGLSARQGELTIAAKLAADGDPVALDALLSSLERRIDAPATANAPAPESVADQPTPGETRQIAQVLKVDQAKIDSLMNLIGELVVSKNSLPFLAKRAEEIYGSREMSREIKEQYAVIDRLAQELQRSIMAVRMLPVSDVLERFTRLVRDLARKLEKQIDLKIEGEDTAADKTIIEALGDPLIHLVRNSIDHGIELPADRVDANKPETATILLKAYQEGDQVVIEVSDDGRGIDPEMIRQKAIEKGLITEEQAGALSDQDAINLVFLPGFSTVKKISDLSGRGVGMDVVRNAVEKVHGEVTISSRKGEGTTVRLSLPLSMAVSRVMMVETADGLFGIPMDAIAETVRVPRRQHTHDQARGDLCPQGCHRAAYSPR
jgi:two-component system chemotaxis sensor kinase CheA